MKGCMRFRHLLFTAFLSALIPLASHAVPMAPVGLPNPSVSNNSPAATHYRTGLGALGKNDFGAAEAAFMESAKADPKFAAALLGLAHVAVKRNQIKAAETWLQKALSIASDNADVQTSWGRYLYAQQKFSKAEIAFKKAISADPGAFAPRIDLADLYLNGLRNPKEAVEAYRAALAIQADHGGAHFGLATALALSGQQTEAAGEFETAGKFAPGNPLPWQALGQLHVEQKQYDKALEAFGKALKAQSDFALVYVSRGDVFTLKGEDSRAIQEYQAALKIAPKYSLAHMRLASTYHRLKRFPESEAAYLAVIDSEPRSALAYNNLAWLSVERKTHLNEALVWAKKAVELAPSTAQFQDTLGWVYRARGEVDKAASVLEKASTIKPPQADIFYHLGLVYEEQGNAKKASSAFKTAVQLRKDFPEATQALRRIEMQNGRF